MTPDLKRELLRHLLATLVYRAGVAISDAPENFAAFRIGETVRTPGEILAHIGDLLEGSLFWEQGKAHGRPANASLKNEEIKKLYKNNTFAKLGRRSSKIVPMKATYSADCLFDLCY